MDDLHNQIERALRHACIAGLRSRETHLAHAAFLLRLAAVSLHTQKLENALRVVEATQSAGIPPTPDKPVMLVGHEAHMAQALYAAWDIVESKDDSELGELVIAVMSVAGWVTCCLVARAPERLEQAAAALLTRVGFSIEEFDAHMAAAEKEDVGASVH